MSTPADWARAYAKQARADFDAWNGLSQNSPLLPQCQRLHFLQMACEKLAKAHLCKAGAAPASLQSSHAYVAKNLPIIVRKQLAGRAGRTQQTRAIVAGAKHLAREIELLSPSVDDGGRRPDNCEYPWEDANGNVLIPSEYAFATLHLATAPAGRTLLKIVSAAIDALM
jgi:hypothetical protein